MREAAHRTPGVSLKEIFLRAAEAVPEAVPEAVLDGGGRAGVVAEALSQLQRGFDAHYAAREASDEAILVGDDAYARAVETIARLDEPRFVTIATRMIRDGVGEISAGKEVSLALWTPHLAGLLDVISGEGEERSRRRIVEAAEREVDH